MTNFKDFELHEAPIVVIPLPQLALALNSALNSIGRLAITGLRVDGEKHKQHYLAEILKAIYGHEGYQRIIALVDIDEGISP